MNVNAIPTIAVTLPVRTSDRTCTFDLGTGVKCMSGHYARGFCEPHYRSLKRAGAFADLPVATKPRTARDLTLANVSSVKRARRKLAKLAPDFVDHLFAGSVIASKKGDTSPAQWAMLHARVIEPINEKGNANSTQGTTINIGVKVSGTDK